METICAILSIAVLKDLKIQQMDVKGAYQNSILKEKVYMHQPEGYENETGRVCLLKKTLYGLKRSRREWNKELNAKLLKHDFVCLRLDLCVYTRRNKSDLQIITI